MNSKLKIALFASVIFSSGSLFAQRDTTKSTYNESVFVVGDYKPVLDGVTEKVNVAPSVNDSVAAELQPKFSYNIIPHRIMPLPTVTGIKAAKVVASPTRLYDNYMRFGLGHDFAALTDFNPLMDIYYTSKRNDDYAYGGRLYHNTDWTTFGKKDKNLPSPDYYGRTRESVTKFDLFGKYILNNKHLFSAQLDFDRQYGRYYGFNDSVLFAFQGLGWTRDNIKHDNYNFAYNNLALNLGAKSLNTDVNQFGYEAQFGMAEMWAKRDFSQFSMQLEGDVHYGFPLLSKYKAVTYMRMKWEGFRQHRGEEPYANMPGIEAYDTLMGVKSGIRHLLTFNPYADFLFKDFKVHAGFGVGLNSSHDSISSKTSFFPDVVVSKSFSNNQMSFTAGFVGGYIANDWNNIRLLNPYVEPVPYSVATVDDNLFAHLRINFSKRLILNVKMDNHFYKNKMFFMLDPISLANGLGNIFTPYYLNVNCMNLGSDFTFVNDEMIRLTVGGDFFLYYNKEKNISLFHTPSFVGYVDVDVNYKDKWLFSAQASLLTKQDAYYDYTINNYKATGQIKAHLGISVEAEYIYSRALSFFAKVENMTLQKYFLWANYPAQRFNLMLGLTYTMPRK